MTQRINTTKLLVSGEPGTHLTTLLERITTLNSSKAGPFDLCICIGTVWHNINRIEQLNQLNIGIPIYCIATNDKDTPQFIIDLIINSDSDTVKICHNLYYLRRCGMVQLHQLTVAYVSGMYTDSDKPTLLQYNNKDIDTLIHKCTTDPYNNKSIDLLITSQWPQSTHNSLFYSIHSHTVPAVTTLAQTLNVRYHFTTHTDTYYAAAPYRNTVHCTRFMSIASVHNNANAKWLYAVNVQKLNSIDTSKLPDDVIECPYKLQTQTNGTSDYHTKLQQLNEQPNKRQKLSNPTFDATALQQQSDTLASITNKWNMSTHDKQQSRGPPPDGYICRRCNEPGHWIQQCTVERQQNNNTKPPSGYICKVCQSTEHYVKQCPTVLAERQQRYSKPPPAGYICKNCQSPDHYIQNCPEFKQSKHKNCWFCLSSPDVAAHLIISIGTHFYIALPKGSLTEQHVLIIPIVHTSSAVELNEEQLNELNQFKSAIKQYYASLNNVCIMYERNIVTRAGQHMHIQCINIVPELASKAQQMIVQQGKDVNLLFDVINDQYTHDNKQKQTLQQRITHNERYIHVELPDSTELLAIVQTDNKNAFDFMRTVLAAVLDQPERADWRQCVVDDIGEERLVEQFKSGFEKYDFAAEE